MLEIESSREAGRSVRHKPGLVKTALVLISIALMAASCGAKSDDTSTTDATSTTDSEVVSTETPQLADSGVPSLESETTLVEVGDDTPALDENSTEEEIFAVWQSCMVDEGLTAVESMTSADLADTAILEADPAFAAAAQICNGLISEAFGSLELDPAMEAELADRSVQLAACGREILDIEIPDNVLFLEEGDPRLTALENLVTTPEQDEAIEVCLQEALGDLVDENGQLITDSTEESDQ